MAEHNDFGTFAEDLAVKFLISNGYRIIRRNYRWRKAEVDIIACQENEIVFVEVKARNSGYFQAPSEAVKRKKIQLLIQAANAFMEVNNFMEEVRFDIISILPEASGEYQIEHIKNAFLSSDYQ